MNPKISIVVPFVKHDFLLGFFNSLPAALNRETAEVIAIDNTWVNGDRAPRKLPDAHVQLLHLYAEPALPLHAAWNMGMRTARGDYICVANDDIVWREKALVNMVEALDINKLRCVYPTHTSGLNILPPPPASQNPHGPVNLIGPPEFRGFCFMLTRECFERSVCDFDEQFELFYGDDDYARRLIAVGSPARQVGNAVIHHFESQSVSKLPVGVMGGCRQRDYDRFVAKYGLSTWQEYVAKRGF